MKVIYPTGNFTAYYGRNPTFVTKYGSVIGGGPSSDSSLISYTVPAGRKAVLTASMLNWYRKTVATTAGIVEFYIQTTINAVAGKVIYIETIRNVIGDYITYFNPGLIYMNSGDTIDVRRSDLSTGGTADYIATCYLVEFDP